MGLCFQLLLDGGLLALCSLGLLGRSRGRLDGLLWPVFAGMCLVTRVGLSGSTDPLAYLLLPIDNSLFMIFLFLAALLFNSLWFQTGEGHILWGTAAQFALYLLLRETVLAGLGLAGLHLGFWLVYGSRLLALLLWLGLWATGLLRWLREQLADGNMPVGLTACNTLLVLFFFRTLQPGPGSGGNGWLLATAGLLVGLILINGGVILWEQRRIQSRQRQRLLEQYLPMVEEAVESVRTRQHEYNNRMLAISAALAAADTLEEARQAVGGMVEDIQLDQRDRELLKCDSKVLSGLLFGKMKQGELRHIRLDITIAGGFLHRSLTENQWVELAGILLDNALEASAPGDTIFFRAVEEDGLLRLTVSNRYRPLSQAEMTEMFRRGWSAKRESGHGYGLFHLRKLMEAHGGKILVRNSGGEPNYLTIGVLAP